MSVDAYMSEEFINFKNKIKNLRKLRVQKQEELQSIVQRIKNEISEIDIKVNEQIELFEQFKNNK